MLTIKDFKLGRIWFPTIEDQVGEMVGDSLDAVGAALAASERRPRPLELTIPVRASSGEVNPYEDGDRMRRQVRSLMENPQARLSGLYMIVSFDSELNGWALVGGGKLEYDQGGVTFADYKLTLSDSYMVARRRTHRPARRVVAYDRRLATTPRDIERLVYSTSFAGTVAVAKVALPHGASDLRSRSSLTSLVGSYATADGGSMGIVSGVTSGDVIHFEQPESGEGIGDVLVLDRRGKFSFKDITRDLFVSWAQARSAALLYAPRTSSEALTNLGSVSLPNGTLANGAALTSAGLMSGAASASLNGGYIDTGWSTRTNLCRNPTLEGGATTGYSAKNGSVVSLDATNPFEGTHCIKVVTSGGGAEEGMNYGPDGSTSLLGFAPKDPVTFSAYVNAPEGVKMMLDVVVQKEGGGTLTTATLAFVGTGAYQRVSVSVAECPAETVSIRPRIYANVKAGETAGTTFFVDNVLIEKSATLGEFFPTLAHLASGLAGWSGAANNSASDIGPFARATGRTFMGMVKRASNETIDTIFGGAGGTVRVQVAAGSNDITATFDGGTTTATWAGAMPGLEAALVALVVSGAEATLYINGESKGTKAIVRGQASSTMLLGAQGSATDPFDGQELPFTVFLKALTADGLGFAPASIDPQEYGWEEVYGPDYPLSSNDVPVIQNGITRVRYLTSPALCFAIDQYVAGEGWVERERVSPAFADSGWITELTYAAVKEWTPERAVLFTRFATASGSVDCYIILQRGWTGPRFEIYTRPSATATKPTLYTIPSNSSQMIFANSANLKSSSESWSGTVTYAENDEPWGTLAPTEGTGITHRFAIGKNGEVGFTADTRFFGETRRGLIWRGTANTSASSGWLGVDIRLTGAESVKVFEAETYRKASGTTSEVSEAAASGEKAVEETQAAETNATIEETAETSIGLLASSYYALYARVRVVTGGATASVIAKIGAVLGLAKTTTSTSYTWLPLGVLKKNSGKLTITLWRSAGAGATRIDRVVAVPYSSPTEDAVGNVGSASLYDSRGVADLVAR